MCGRMERCRSNTLKLGLGLWAALLCSGAVAAVAFSPSALLRPSGMTRVIAGSRGQMGRLLAALGPPMHKGAARGGEAPARQAGSVLAARMSADDSVSDVYDFKRRSGEGKKVLVAGGAGYIGTHLCADLLMNNYEVCILDNFANSSPQAVERVVNHPPPACYLRCICRGGHAETSREVKLLLAAFQPLPNFAHPRPPPPGLVSVSSSSLAKLLYQGSFQPRRAGHDTNSLGDAHPALC